MQRCQSRKKSVSFKRRNEHGEILEELPKLSREEKDSFGMFSTAS
jgi:hypothetical protein